MRNTKECASVRLCQIVVVKIVYPFIEASQVKSVLCDVGRPCCAESKLVHPMDGCAETANEKLNVLLF